MENFKKFFTCTAFLLSIVVLIQWTLPVEAHAHTEFQQKIPVKNDTLPKGQSKEKHFSVSKKQKLVNDTLPKQFDSIVVPISPTRKLPDTIGLPAHIDTISSSTDTIPSTLSPGDSSDISQQLKYGFPDSTEFRLADNALEAKVEYYANDSMVLDIDAKTATLYGTQSTTNYKNNEIKGPIIEFDQEKGEIMVALIRDSLGKVIAMPSYKQADFTSQSDTFRFNLKTGKGLSKSTYTQQGEMYVYGKVIKKVSDDVFYALRGRFTTCNLDTPHFAFVFNKIKVINDKVAISGPVHPEFEGVPIPVYLPFGIFPLTKGRHSGFIGPTFTTNEQRGVGLEGIGYYKVISEYWDVILRSSIYSYGGWSMNINPRYSKRYKYNGNIALDIQHFNFNFKGDPDFRKNRSFNIRWSHSADTKARPGVNFSANVNAGSSSYNEYNPNDPFLNVSNRLTSSITYSKTWKGTPFNLTLSANHNQNTNNKSINISLPNLSFSMNTIYPFRKKEFVGELKWYENIGIGYNVNAENHIRFSDDTARDISILRQILDTMQWGVRHSIPISLSLPPLGAFNISPSVSYEETWFQNSSAHYYNSAKDTLFTQIDKGFYTMRQMSFGVSASTRLFGMLTAKKKNSKIIAIRQEIRPSVGFSYRPDLNRNKYYTLTDSNGRVTDYSYIEGRYNVYGPYGRGEFGGLNFGIESNISMKIRSRKDTGDKAIKKVALLDAFGIRGNYNFLADSLRFSPLSMNASTNLFNKVSITAYATFDLYQVDDSGRTIDRLIWKDKPLSLGRLRSGGVSLGSQFQGGDKTKDKEPGFDNYRPNPDYGKDQYMADAAYIQTHPGEFANFNIPWSVNFSYALTFFKRFYLNEGFKTILHHSINFGGTLNMTPKWQLGLRGSYNVSEGKLLPFSISVSRDLHCWQMSINIVPSGTYRYFSINISPKSSLLRDLRINRTEQFRQL